MSEPEYAGCVSAFVDSLAGELNTSANFLKRLQGSAKGAAFAYEMSFDRGRYGALLVLDRWRHFNLTFGPHLGPVLHHPVLKSLLEEAERRVTAGETILARANELIDAAGSYHPDLVEAGLLAFQQVKRIFQEEIEFSEKAAQLGPLLPEEQRNARAQFLADLAQR